MRLDANNFGLKRMILTIAAVATVAGGLLFVGAPNSEARDKRLTAAQAQQLVRNLKAEMATALYDVLNLPGVKAERARFERRWRKRGSMTGKTRKQVIDLFIKDVKLSYSDKDIRREVVDAINRYRDRR